MRASCQPEKPCRARRGYYFRAWVKRLRRAGFKLEWRVLNAADYGDATTRRRFFLLGRRDGKPIRWPTPTHSRDGSGDLFASERKRWRAAREVIDWSIQGRSIFTRKKPLSPKTLARIYAGAVRFSWPEPFLVILRQHMDAQSVDLPLPTLTAGGTHVGLAQPIVLPQHRSNKARSVEQPAPTVTTTSRGIALVEPFVTRTDMHKSNSSCVRSTDDPLATLTTAGGFAVVQPFIVPQHGGGAPRATTNPLPTVTTDGAHALVAPYYSQSGCKSTKEPLPTLTTRDRFALVMPVTHQDQSNRARDLDQPIPTVTGANRGELAFVAAAFGERKGQPPRVHSVEEPTPTICATGRVNLVEARGYDVLFRMLQPHELAAAMGFEDYDFAGNKTEVTRQIGNAVAVGVAAALVGALLGCP